MNTEFGIKRHIMGLILTWTIVQNFSFAIFAWSHFAVRPHYGVIWENVNSGRRRELRFILTLRIMTNTVLPFMK